MAPRKWLIPQIDGNTKNWTCQITITEDLPTLISPKGFKTKRYILTDEEGNVTPATVFDSDINDVVPNLHLFGVYQIKNAPIRFIPQQYRILPNINQWVFQRDTFIRPVPEAIPYLNHFLDDLIPFSTIANNTNPNLSNIDIMGVILAGQEEPITITTSNAQKTIQRFTFVNNEKIPLNVTLWDDICAKQGPVLLEAARSLSVVVAKRLSFSTYKGVALSAKNSSSFAVNPPIEAVRTLKSWIDNKSTIELEELLIDKSITISRQLVTKGSLKTHTLAEIENISKDREFWVKGSLQISEEHQNLFYLGCNYCNYRVSADEEGLVYPCNKCKKTDAITTPRPIVTMLVTDQTGSTKVLAIHQIAERILQTTAADIYRLSRMGETYDLDSIRAEFAGKIFMISLRRNAGPQTEYQRKMMLLDYFEESILSQQAQSSHQSNSSETKFTEAESSSKAISTESSSSPLSPLKRQLSQITLTQQGSSKKKLSRAKDDVVDKTPDVDA